MTCWNCDSGECPPMELCQKCKNKLRNKSAKKINLKHLFIIIFFVKTLAVLFLLFWIKG